ncbi:MAG: HAD family hydrolase [Chloroflexi bacterium]|nr:HAD family hydrolase [Chloroflexota bacterium]
MKYLAVIFDLFGTLVDNFVSSEYEDSLAQMASTLSLSPGEFRQVWYQTFREQNTGEFPGCESHIKHICSALGVECEQKQVKMAMQLRLDYIRHVMTPRPGALEVLALLREQGCKTGLVTNCSAEIPVIWPEHPLSPLIDIMVFSCSVGLRKPDPRIYQLGTEQLGVRPDQCLFVGDGSNQELTGALAVGMQPVLIRFDAESTEPHLINRERWDGLKVSSLMEVLTIIGESERQSA